jgi:hypothetical protein
MIFVGEKTSSRRTSNLFNPFLCKLQTRKNSHRTRAETMVAAGHGLYYHLWPVLVCSSQAILFNTPEVMPPQGSFGEIGQEGKKLY